MTTLNPFDLLGDVDNDDPNALLAAAQQHKVAAAAAATTKKPAPGAVQPVKPAKLPTKPLPPAQAVKESRNEAGRGGRGGGGGRGFGRGGFNRDSGNGPNNYGNDNGPPRAFEDKPSERRPYSGPARGGYRGDSYNRGGRRGGFSNGEAGDEERPRRTYDRHSGTGRGFGVKRDGAGRGNWGTPADEISQETEQVATENEVNGAVEKPVNEEENASDAAKKENAADETEEKELEEQQMTLEEYEKVLEEKRKALQAMKVEERKVDTKEFESMKMIAKKPNEEDVVFAKLGTDKDKRNKEAADKEEKAKKSLSINEFLKPAEGESYHRSGGRGRGRGRGGYGGGGGGRGNGSYGNAPAPSIADPGHFPTLGGK